MRRALLLLALIGCGSNGGGDIDAGGDPIDGAQVLPPDAAPLEWEVVEVVFQDDTIVTERVKYRTEGLLIDGQVCRPRAAGVYPVIVYNHGGFSGLGVPADSGNCVDVARSGFVWIGSSYRGEDASEGAIEVCLGEVTDVLRMIEIALAQPYADPDRVIMWGASHGGCITARAVQRGAPVHGAVDVFGPTDLAANHAFWVAGIEAKSPYAAAYMQLIDIVETATGGSPGEAAAEYEARSPSRFDFPAGVPVLVTQGVVDPLVPPDQSCRLVAASSGFVSYHLDGTQAEVTTPPAGCEDSGITWTAGPRPNPDWPGERYLVVYDGVGHDFAGAGGAEMLDDVITFLFAKLPTD